MQGAGSDSQEVAREAWVDLKGDMEHALPLAQPKLLKGIQLYFAELDVQSKLSCSFQHLHCAELHSALNVQPKDRRWLVILVHVASLMLLASLPLCPKWHMASQTSLEPGPVGWWASIMSTFCTAEGRQYMSVTQ